MGDTITVLIACGVCEREVPVVVPKDAIVGTAVEAFLRVHDPATCQAQMQAAEREG